MDVIREGFRKTRPHTVEPSVTVALQCGDHVTNFGLHGLHGGATVATQLAVQQVRRLDAVGALVDRRNAHVPQILRRTGFLNVAHAAVYLHPQRGHLHTQLSEPAFDHGDHQINAALTRLAGPLGTGVGKVHGHRLRIRQRAHGFIERTHCQQHALHIGVLHNRYSALNPLPRVGHRLLVCALGGTETLQAHL